MGNERRSPCVQFLAVMKCRACWNWPNLGLQKQFGWWKWNWWQMSSRGAETVMELAVENWRALDSLWGNDVVEAGGVRRDRPDVSCCPLGCNYSLIKSSCVCVCGDAHTFLLSDSSRLSSCSTGWYGHSWKRLNIKPISLISCRSSSSDPLTHRL